MRHAFVYIALAIVAITALVINNLTINNNNDIIHHRALQTRRQNPNSKAAIAERNRLILSQKALAKSRHRLTLELSHPNATISQELSTAAQSYCDGNDLVEYPVPKYDACPPDSILNIIPSHGGMTNALKFILLGALLSFEENRCFIVSEENSHLHPDFKNTGVKKSYENGFMNHFFEEIGLPHDHPFVVEKMKGRPLPDVQVRDWREYWDSMRRRRIEGYHFQFNTSAYSHPLATANGIELKRDFLRHMWHLRPAYRDHTCQALKDHEIFDTDYIGMSIRRGDKKKENHFKPPTMSDYILEAERVIPYIFKNGQAVKVFVATDDCTMLPTLRQARPQWAFISQCDQLAETQMGYDINDIPDMNEEQREEHFRKFFIELYALALSKVYIGVAYTNVAWFAYMMRPNVDKSTFILLDRLGFATENALSHW